MSKISRKGFKYQHYIDAVVNNPNIMYSWERDAARIRELESELKLYKEFASTVRRILANVAPK